MVGCLSTAQCARLLSYCLPVASLWSLFETKSMSLTTGLQESFLTLPGWFDTVRTHCPNFEVQITHRTASSPDAQGACWIVCSLVANHADLWNFFYEVLSMRTFSIRPYEHFLWTFSMNLLHKPFEPHIRTWNSLNWEIPHSEPKNHFPDQIKANFFVCDVVCRSKCSGALRVQKTFEVLSKFGTHKICNTKKNKFTDLGNCLVLGFLVFSQ